MKNLAIIIFKNIFKKKIVNVKCEIYICTPKEKHLVFPTSYRTIHSNFTSKTKTFHPLHQFS